MEFINGIVDGIGTAIDFLKTSYDIVITILCFLPEPFFSITIAFSFLLLSIFAFKFFKG